MSGKTFFYIIAFLFFMTPISFGLIIGCGYNIYDDIKYSECIENLHSLGYIHEED